MSRETSYKIDAMMQSTVEPKIAKAITDKIFLITVGKNIARDLDR